MKKLLFLIILLNTVISKAQSFDQTLLDPLTDESNGKFEKTTIYTITLADGSNEVIKTNFESYNTIISRDNFVRYYSLITENIIFENVRGIKLLKKVTRTTELPILILNFKLNKNGVSIEITDSDGSKNTFKNWPTLIKDLKIN